MSDRTRGHRVGSFVWAGLTVMCVTLAFVAQTQRELTEVERLTAQVVLAVVGALSLLGTILSLRRSGRTVVGAVGFDSKEQTPDAALEDAQPSKFESEAIHLRAELAASNQLLKQAGDAYRFLEERLKQAQDELKRFVEREPDPDPRVPELEGKLRRAEATILELSAGDRTPELEQRLALAEAKAKQARERAVTLAMELEAARKALVPHAEPAPNGHSQLDADVITSLEERILAAERRAEKAERTLEELTSSAPPEPILHHQLEPEPQPEPEPEPEPQPKPESESQPESEPESEPQPHLHTESVGPPAAAGSVELESPEEHEPPADHPLADRSAVKDFRARLARTAARKRSGTPDPGTPEAR